MAEGDILVEMRGVSRDYQLGKTVLRALIDVSLDIERGGFVVIAGPSINGKSTLLNLIGCIDQSRSVEKFRSPRFCHFDDGFLVSGRLIAESSSVPAAFRLDIPVSVPRASSELFTPLPGSRNTATHPNVSGALSPLPRNLPSFNLHNVLNSRNLRGRIHKSQEA